MSESVKRRTAAIAIKSTASQLLKLFGAVRTELAALRTMANTLRTLGSDLQTLANDIRSKLQGDYTLVTPGLAIGGTNTAVSSLAFTYIINGKGYNKAAVSAGTAPGNDVVPTGLYGAVAFDIGADGTIDAVEASANETGYASAVLAVAGLPAPAADHARMGWVTASKSDGSFTFGTTALNAANTTVAYTDADTCFTAIGAAVSSSLPAALTENLAE